VGNCQQVESYIGGREKSLMHYVAEFETRSVTMDELVTVIIIITIIIIIIFFFFFIIFIMHKIECKEKGFY
jgi:hypothetical protein